MKILSFLLVQSFLIANIAQADFSRDVPDKMPVSHFQNRKFRKPTIEPESNYRKFRKATIRTEGNYSKSLKGAIEPKVIKSEEVKAVQVTAPPKPEYASSLSPLSWGVKAAVWGGKTIYKGAKYVGIGALGGAGIDLWNYTRNKIRDWRN